MLYTIFIEKTLKEYRSLCNHKKQNQIVLWFDSDLFCQINMLAVISWLQTHRKDAEISLVSCSSKKAKKGALGCLNKEELHTQFNHRTVLTQDDITFADYVWQLYCSDNPIQLEQITDYKSYQYPYLENAIKTHLQRFPSIANGLNVMENKMLQTAIDQQPISKKAFMQTVLQEQENLGFGTLQYERALTRLKPLFGTFNPVKLTKKGKEILEKQTNYYAAIQSGEVYLGGSLKYNFLYNTTTDRILKL